MRTTASVSAAVLAAAFSAACGVARQGAADGAPPPSPPATPSPKGAERGIDPERFTPYFEGSRGGDAVALLDRASYPEARAAFLELAGSAPDDGVLAPRARFVAAVCAHRTGEHEAAVVELLEAAEALPLVADHALYLAAVSAYRTGGFEQSIEIAARVGARSPLAPDAELVAGDALRALGRQGEAERHYRVYVHRRRAGPRLAEATFKLAEAVERQLSGAGPLDRVREAVRWYRRVVYRFPRSDWASQARARLGVLAGRLPESERAGATALSADEQLELADAMARGQRHQEAMREYAKVLETTDPDGPLGCRARLGRGRAAYNARKRAVADPILTETAERCDEPDVRAWALYLGARSRTARGGDRGAVELYATLESEHPDHRLADDARLRRAQALLRLGDSEAAVGLLARMPADYPDGDMVCEGGWQLAWHHYRAGELEAALAALVEANDSCREPAEGAHGRELYWAGRVRERLGRRDEALRSFEAVVRGSPLTYYMMLALDRIEALDPPRAELLRREIATPPEGDQGRPWRFDPVALRERPALVRGIELLRMALGSLARAELAVAREPRRGEDELLWLLALLHDRAGEHPESVSIARRELGSWRQSYPAGESRRHWIIAYPMGFGELVRQEAERAGVEPELLWAVMREESSFSPRVESPANAVGLLQLLPSTAARFAKGLPADRESLRRPEVNVPIAARYLAFLLARNGGVPLLAVASYNAGEGAVDRWCRAEPALELDEALESFSYDETRRYARRVLTSYGTYHYLHGDGRIPPLVRRGGTGRGGSSPPPPGPGAPEEASSGVD